MTTNSSTPAPKSNILHPDPILAAEGLDISFPIRFFKKVKKTDICFHWEGATAEDHGHAKILRAGRRGRSIAVNRASFLIHNGAIPEGVFLLNVCPAGDKSCVHPNHWKVADTNRVPASAAQHPHIPMTPEQIARAELMCAQSKTTMEDIERTKNAAHVTPQWMIDLGFSISFANRFWAKVRKTENGCWLWTASKDPCAYGTIGKGPGGPGNIISAHRASYMLHKGPVPQGMDVLHNCKPNKDNPSCVNPDHLWLGAANDNSRDATEKCWEERRAHWTIRKLTPEMVDEMLHDHACGATAKELGEKFNVSPGYVRQILNGTRWAGPQPKNTETGS